MSYLILTDQNGEFERRELRDAIVIGRSLDCDICVRDILLSRKHCKIERFDNRWVVSDLGSKNGTRVGTEVITRHVLADGDVLRMGKIQVSFITGAFVPAPVSQQRRRDIRPADPKEALSGTVLGFQLFDMEEDSRVSGFPIPKPKPAEPAAYRQENVRSIVSDIASTQWDQKISKTEARPKPAAKVQPEPQAQPGSIERHRISEQKKNPDPAPDRTRSSTKAVVRDPSPDQSAKIPMWLAWFYVAMVCLVGGTAIGVIVAKSILPLNWLAQ